MRLKMITEYKRDGYHAQLLKSERLSDTGSGYPRFACIYERTRKGVTPHYEVVILYGVGASTIGDKDFPDRLQVPSPEMWGKRGWTYTDYEQADNKHREICQYR